MHMVLSQESSYRSGNKRNTTTEGVSEEPPVMSKKGKKNTFKSKVLEVGEDISKVAKMLLERNSDADKCFEKLNVVVPVDQQTRYRGRGKGECFQNVLGICNFDMIFTFVWAGWEGIAHDSRVLKEVAFNPTSGFQFPPPDKYYLCDAAYTNTRGFMAPYRGTRYWLADFRRQRALTKEEKFNHAHAQLRNVIERAYGVLKARFPILKQMAPFPFRTQRDIVIACFAVHNFIRKWNIHDELFMSCDEDNLFAEVHEGESDTTSAHDMEWGSQGVEYMAILRENIASQMMPSE